MRSKALSFLLSLSLMFCVGFGNSLTASAATSQFDFVCEIHNYENNPPEIQYGSGSVLLKSSTSTSPSLTFDMLIPYGLTLYEDVNGYYLLNTIVHSQEVKSISGTVTYYNSSNEVLGTTNFSRPISALVDNSYNIFFNSSSVVGVGNSSKITRIRFTFNWGAGASRFETVLLSGALIQSGSSDGSDSIVEAIEFQTNQLQQSIEDQYAGDPGESFPVDDIITQHNEKMGVLSFSSDALMQVLGLLSPDQTLSSELVFPSMSLTIAGQRNRVQLWPEYRFDLNTLKQHWPDFIGLMQSLTSALVWIFVLRYCYRVFEKYFLAGGGS